MFCVGICDYIDFPKPWVLLYELGQSEFLKRAKWPYRMCEFLVMSDVIASVIICGFYDAPT